jgi:AcrR family transcriptional regulator
VVAAIIDSARTLFAERGPAAVSLREIARDAGVNFGLVYQYVGTKEQLIAEVVRRTAAEAADQLAGLQDFDEALRYLMSMGNGTAGRILAWAVLEGRDTTTLYGDSPALALLAERARQDAGREVADEDARLLAATAMVLAAGWRLFGSAALAAAGLEPANPRRYSDRIAQYIELLGRSEIIPEAGQLPKPTPGRKKVRRPN